MPSHVLKAHDARELAPKLAFNFEDLRHQAAAHLAAAKKDAAAIIEQARRESEALKQRAQAEGREAGRIEGMKDAANQIEQRSRKLADERLGEQLKLTLPAVAKVADQLGRERDQWLKRWEQSAVELSLAVAAKLVRNELAARPERSATMIKAALELAVGQPQVRIHLHPQDRERLGNRAEHVVKSITACAHAELVDDATLSPGGCRIETQHGEIDARLETMLARIAEELLGD